VAKSNEFDPKFETALETFQTIKTSFIVTPMSNNINLSSNAEFQ